MTLDNPKYQKMLKDLLTECKRTIPKENEELIGKAFGFSIDHFITKPAFQFGAEKPVFIDG